MYSTINFKTKKALKEAVAAAQEGGQPVTCYQPGPFGPDVKDGTHHCCEGPHEYHRWYAGCTVKDGIIIKVNS